MARQPRRKKYHSKEVTADPSLEVAGTDALPGSAEKIEVLAGRYAGGRPLHAEGDVIDDPSRQNHFLRSGNGYDVNTGLEVVLERPEPGKKRVAQYTAESSPKTVRVGTQRTKGVVAKYLRAYRLEHRLSYGQLAILLKMDRSHVHKLESGDFSDLRLSTLIGLADVLRVSLDELVGRVIPARAV